MTAATKPVADVEVPEIALTPFVLQRALELGDRPALIDGFTGEELTFAQVYDQVHRLAGGLQARGFEKGDVLAIFAPNMPAYAVAFHGTTLAGGTVTTINPVYNTTELEHQLADADAKCLITVPDAVERAREAAGTCGIEDSVVVIGENSWDELLASDPIVDPPEIDVYEDIAALPYSSGTTGSPKGVMLTHHNLVANLVQSEDPLGMDDDETVIGVLPFFHIYGLTCILNLSLASGVPVVTMGRFELERFLSLIAEHRVTRVWAVPPIVLALAQSPLVDDYDVSSIRKIVSGAAPLGEDLQRTTAERLGCRLVQGYGMTESSPVTHVGVGETDLPGAIGPAIPGTECRIVAVESGADAAAGERGELWIRGPQVMKGYLNRPEATSETVDADGWLRTGDIAIADDGGCCRIVDRVKELIKYKGFQVAPAELEALLISHPKIADAAVVPVPDEAAGELPKAFVVLAGEISPDEIKAFVAEQVSSYKQIRLVEVIDEIPKSASGKILRRVLRDQISAG